MKSRVFLLLGAAWLLAGFATAEVPSVLLDPQPICGGQMPDVASQPGGFVASWIRGDLYLQRFNENRAAIRSRNVIRLSDQASDVQFTVNTAPDGSGVVVWSAESQIQASFFDSDGSLQGSLPLPVGVDNLPQGLLQPTTTRLPDGSWLTMSNVSSVAVRFTPDGVIDTLDLGFEASVLVAVGDEIWLVSVGQFPTSPPSGGVLLQRFDAAGEALGEPFSQVEPGFMADADLVVDDLGRASLAWAGSNGVRLQRFDPAGVPMGPIVEMSALPVPFPHAVRVDLTTDPAGNRVVAWEESVLLPTTEDPRETSSRLWARSVLADNALLSEPMLLADAVDDPDVLGFRDPRAALTGPGVATVVAWGQTPPRPAEAETPCEVLGPFALPFALGGDRHLLLQEGRFRVRVDWQDPFNGGSGVGHAVQGTRDAGSFWFFDPDNKEIEIKVLDGRPINGHFWVFAAGLSNIFYEITVTDQRTGLEKTFTNPAEEFGNFIDTEAFPSD